MSPGGMTPRGQREFIEVGGWGSPRAAPGICLSRDGANLAQPGLGPTLPPPGATLISTLPGPIVESWPSREKCRFNQKKITQTS